MSDSALKDLNVAQSGELEKNMDNSVKSCITKPVPIGNICLKKEENAPPTCPDAVTNGCEAGNVDVEYTDSENLTDLPDADASLSTLAARLDSKDWVMTCEALNNVRQLAIYHKEILQEHLESLVPLIVKSVKNPRSAVCKTALMTCADIFKAYGDLLVDSIDPLLVQLFLKASQDKRFVCEAAETALISMTSWITPSALLPKMQPYLKNKNPRIRAKASVCFSKSVPHFVSDSHWKNLFQVNRIFGPQLLYYLPMNLRAAKYKQYWLQLSFLMLQLKYPIHRVYIQFLFYLWPH
ncbi:hypothetical protein GUJ93_ZPchr0008g12557 [Zizania palustris]|uniref:TOG domain-containing protein n=1 Tax=Zizania palustris TaxID=103762 RepID=A0A8J5RZV9_ZIZPA|nr:hypothetical protein GUJ93_ZPchr0008g12557 [Zizania palustris]